MRWLPDQAGATVQIPMSHGLETGFILDRQWFWLRGEMERTKRPALLALARIFTEAQVPFAVIRNPSQQFTGSFNSFAAVINGAPSSPTVTFSSVFGSPAEEDTTSIRTDLRNSYDRYEQRFLANPD